MDESIIAANLAKNIPEEPTPTVDTNITDTPINSDINHNPVQLDDPILNQRLSDYFELGRMDKYTEKAQLQLRTILEWAGSQTSEQEDIMLVIARAERELGIQSRTNRLGLLYKFVKLQAESQRIQKEVELLTYGAI